jgi:hypothetical protein
LAQGLAPQSVTVDELDLGNPGYGGIAKQNASMTCPEAIRAMMETILHILSKGAGEKPTKKVKVK